MKKVSIFFILIALFLCKVQSLQAETKEDISVQVDANTGTYTVSSFSLGWTFAGSIGQPVNNIKRESSVTIRGYAEKNVIADKGKVKQDAASHLFTLEVLRPAEGDMASILLRSK